MHWLHVYQYDIQYPFFNVENSDILFKISQEIFGLLLQSEINLPLL